MMGWRHTVVLWLLVLSGCVTEGPSIDTTAMQEFAGKQGQSLDGFFAVESDHRVAIYDFSLKFVGKPSLLVHMVPLSQHQIACGKKTGSATVALIDHSVAIPADARNVRKLEATATSDILAFPQFKHVQLHQETPGVFIADALTFDLRDPLAPHLTFKGQKVKYAWRQNDGALALSNIVCPLKGFETAQKQQNWRDLAKFGNWCGLGHGGEKINEPQPIDDVDAVCMAHDLCYAEKGMHDCGCDAAFLKEMPRAKSKGEHSKLFRSAAISSFTQKPCQCQALRLENFCNLSGCFDRQMVMASVGTGGACQGARTDSGLSLAPSHP